MKNSSIITIFVALLVVFVSTAASAVASLPKLTYHGKLIMPDGHTPVSSSNVQFRLQIRTPGSENCLMYEELHTRDMSQSEGNFAITINESPTSANTEPTPLERLFQNRGTFTFAGGKCTSGTTYVPSAGDGRKLVVQFNDGSGWEDAPAQEINYVPAAVESMSVGGYSSDSLLRVVDGSANPVTISPMTQTDFTKLLTFIASGNATNFTGSLGGDVTGTQGATVVGKLQGRTVSTTAPTNGQVLKWNNGSSQWEPAADAGASGAVLGITGTAPVTVTGTASNPIINVNAELTGLSALSSNGFVKRTGAGTYSVATSLSFGTDVTGTIPATAGGTGLTAYGTSNQMLGMNSGGTALEYKTMTAGSNITLTPAAGSLTIAATIPSINLASGVTGVLPSANGGTGLSTAGTMNQILGMNGTGSALEYKTLAAGSGVTITPSAGTLTIAATGAGESTTASNIGTAGVGVFKQLSSSDLQFKKISAASSAVTITDNTGANQVDIGVNAELGGLAGLSSNGYVKRTAAGTYSSVSSFGVSDLNFAGTMAVNTGILVRDGSQFYNKTCSGNEVLIWTVANGWSCSAVVLSESDPKVGANTTNYLSKWNGSALVASTVTDSSGNVGIGVASASNKLVVGDDSTGATASAANTISVGSASGNSLITFGQSASARGFVGWVYNATPANGWFTIGVPVGSTQPILMQPNGGSVGIGGVAPNSTQLLDVNGSVRVLASVEGAAANASTGASLTIADLSRNVRRYTLDQNTTITLPAITNLPTDAAYSLTIRVKQDATGSRTLAISGNSGQSIKWDSGSMTAPATAANTETIYQFMIIGGETTWYASAVWKEN